MSDKIYNELLKILATIERTDAKISQLVEHFLVKRDMGIDVKVKPTATTEKPLISGKKMPNFLIVKNIEDYISMAGKNLSYKLTNGANQVCYIAKIHVESINEDNTRLTVIPGKEWTLDKLEWK